MTDNMSVWRSQIRKFLVDYFSLQEMREVAFDLGIAYETLPHHTAGEFAMELVGYFARRRELKTLVARLLELRPDANLAALLAQLPESSRPFLLLLVKLDNPLPLDSSEWRGNLANSLGIADDDIQLLAMANGSIELLIALPVDASVRFRSRVRAHDPGMVDLGILAVLEFYHLTEEQRLVWRLIAFDWPPEAEGHNRRPTISFAEATVLLRNHIRPSGRSSKSSKKVQGVQRGLPGHLTKDEVIKLVKESRIHRRLYGYKDEEQGATARGEKPAGAKGQTDSNEPRRQTRDAEH